MTDTMPIIPITQYGDDVLNKKTVPVEKVDAALIEFVTSMFETMQHADGVGLAANQAGSNKSIFIIDLTEVKGFEKFGKMTFINPKITKRSEETMIGEEGCLSIPYLRAEVKRPRTITITYNDLQMNKQELEASDFLSRVIQHEYDHLQGVYFTDRVEEPQKSIKDYLIKVKNREIECDYPVTPKPISKNKSKK